jgi:hypothetical protein
LLLEVEGTVLTIEHVLVLPPGGGAAWRALYGVTAPATEPVVDVETDVEPGEETRTARAAEVLDHLPHAVAMTDVAEGYLRVPAPRLDLTRPGAPERPGAPAHSGPIGGDVRISSRIPARPARSRSGACAGRSREGPMNLFRIAVATAITCALSGVAAAESLDRPRDERRAPRLSFTPPLDAERVPTDAVPARPAPREAGPRAFEDGRSSNAARPSYPGPRASADARPLNDEDARGDEFRADARPTRERLADEREEMRRDDRDDGFRANRPRGTDLWGTGLRIVEAVKSFADAAPGAADRASGRDFDRPAPRPYADDPRADGWTYGHGGRPMGGGYDRPVEDRFGAHARRDDGYDRRWDDDRGSVRDYADTACTLTARFGLGRGDCASGR